MAHQDAVVRQEKNVHFAASPKIPSVIIAVEDAAPIDAAVTSVVTSAAIAAVAARYTISN